MKRIFLLSILLVTCLGVYSNDFEWKSKIDSIPKTGFYKVLLSSEIVAAMQASGSDIRLFDSKHQEVPYIFEEEKPLQKLTDFKEYEIIENSHLEKPAITRVVIRNKTKRNISSFVMILRNSEVEKEITLKGSDDQKNWYIIKRNYPVSSAEYDGSTSEVRILDFPKSNFEFFELSMNDKQKDRLQILKVGHYDSESHIGTYTEIPAPQIHQKDSLTIKKSYINLKFKDSYELSRLEFLVIGPVFYKRNCTIGYYVKHKNQTFFEVIGQFIASSEKNPLCNLEKIKAKELILVIDNEDNEPLQVISAKGYFLNKYLATYLKAGEHYDVYFGNKSLDAPDYDLKYFADNMKKDVTVIKTGVAERIHTVATPSVSIFFSKTFLWITILIVVGLLTWFSIRMIKEMGKQA